MMKQRWIYDGLTVEIEYRDRNGDIMYKKITIKYDDVKNRTEAQGVAIMDAMMTHAKKEAKNIQVIGGTYKINHKKVYENA